VTNSVTRKILTSGSPNRPNAFKLQKIMASHSKVHCHNGEFTFLLELSRGNKPLTYRNKSIAISNLEKAKKYGFQE